MESTNGREDIGPSRSRSRSPSSQAHALQDAPMDEHDALERREEAKRAKLDRSEVTDQIGAEAGATKPPGSTQTSIPLSHPPSVLDIKSPITTIQRDNLIEHDSASEHSATPTPSGFASGAASPDKKLEAKLRKAALDKKRRQRKKAEAEALREQERKEGKDKASKDKKRPKGKTGDGSDSEDDDAYCICKGANQEDDTFIGCEICDGWFHPGCMGIDEEAVEKLDVYVCPPCEEKTGRTTVYKRLCKREGCGRTARSTSKFCSSRCAFQHAQKIAATVEKKETALLESSLNGYPSPTPVVSVEVVDGAADEKVGTEDGTATLLASLQAQSADVDRLAALVVQRQNILAQAVTQWEAMQPVPAAEPAPAPKKKNKNKRRDGEALERVCGWDPRLAWSDDEVRACDGSAAETVKVEDGDVDMEAEAGVETGTGNLCTAGKRCERHQGWQRTLAVTLDVEAAQLARKKDELEAIMERIARVEEVEAAGAKAKSLFHARLK